MDKPNIVFFMLDQLSAKWLEAASAGACPTVLEMTGQTMPPMPKDGCHRDKRDADLPSLPGGSLKSIVLQDWPRTRRDLFALGVH
ncbi:MAG: hypothetical protein HN368_08800 [Spirochaetales bacterium]|jgi:hypothetical protein|nr:hypothetical protein [Spirochaetales bacterium]